MIAGEARDLVLYSPTRARPHPEDMGDVLACLAGAVVAAWWMPHAVPIRHMVARILAGRHPDASEGGLP